MKWLRTLVLFNKGGVVESTDWAAIHESYVRAIESIDFPSGSGKLTLRRRRKKSEGGSRNGVKYLRTRFLDNIVATEGWKAEVGFDLDKNAKPVQVLHYPSMETHEEPLKSRFGHFDHVTTAPNGTHVVIEWETGNVSSSHRSMNKLAIALATGKIQAGVLIVPSRDLYQHLTDRVGNISELSGYLAMWQGLGSTVKKGLLAVTVVEHDGLTDFDDHPHLPVGKDGRAKEGAAKRRATAKKSKAS